MGLPIGERIVNFIGGDDVDKDIKKILTPVIETNDVYGLIEDDADINEEQGITIETEQQGAYDRMERLEEVMSLAQIYRNKKRFPFKVYRLSWDYDVRMELRFRKALKLFHKSKKIIIPHTMFDP